MIGYSPPPNEVHGWKGGKNLKKIKHMDGWREGKTQKIKYMDGWMDGCMDGLRKGGVDGWYLDGLH